MTYFDEARAIRAMLEARKLTQARLAELLGVSQPYIANKLRLLTLSETVERHITDAGLSERHARILLRLHSDEDKLRLIERIKLCGMSVQETETAVDLMLEDGLLKAPFGTNFAERVGHFERVVDASLANLRSFGIRARARTERENDKLYITICIE